MSNSVSEKRHFKCSRHVQGARLGVSWSTRLQGLVGSHLIILLLATREETSPHKAYGERGGNVDTSTHVQLRN